MITSQSPLPGWRIAPGNVAKLWPPGRRLGIDAGFYTCLYRSYDVLYWFYADFMQKKCCCCFPLVWLCSMFSLMAKDVFFHIVFILSWSILQFVVLYVLWCFPWLNSSSNGSFHLEEKDVWWFLLVVKGSICSLQDVAHREAKSAKLVADPCIQFKEQEHIKFQLEGQIKSGRGLAEVWQRSGRGQVLDQQKVRWVELLNHVEPLKPPEKWRNLRHRKSTQIPTRPLAVFVEPVSSVTSKRAKA